MFRTGHALPLVKTRILRPRNRRGKATRWPRIMTSQWPLTRLSHIHGFAMNRSRPQTFHEHGQSMSTVYPRPLARPQTFHSHAANPPRLIHELTTDTTTDTTTICPLPVHRLATFLNNLWPRSRTFHVLAADNPSLRHRIATNMVPPIHFPTHIHLPSSL